MQHSEGRFKGYDGLDLYYQFWVPKGSPKAILLVVHGFAEHGGRYGNLVDYFLPRGYGFYIFDLRGHGNQMEQGDTPTGFPISLATWKFSVN